MSTAMSTDSRSHDNLQHKLLAINFAFPAIATVAVFLRIYVRVSTRTFAIDDWIICFAAVLYWAETITSDYVIRYTYMGYHFWDIPDPNPHAVGAGKFTYATEILYNPILSLVKYSILLFLQRLAGQKISVRWAIWIIMILNTIVLIVTFFMAVFRCVPVASNWNPAAYPDAKCLNFANYVTGTACAAIFTDVLVLILPTWIVYNLRMGQKQKLMLIGILSLGLGGIIAGLVRIILLDSYDRKLDAHTIKDYDHNVYFSLSTIEIGIVIVAACAPSFKPLVAKILPKFFSTGGRSGPHYAYNSDGLATGPRAGTGAGAGYGLNNLSRTRGTHHTQDDGIMTLVGGEDETYSNGSVGKNKNGIMLTTETEVKWHAHDHGREGNRGSSTESLVQPVR